MLRTQISLTDRERRLLDTLSARTGKSIAALIRDAVNTAYGDEGRDADDLAAMRRAAGAWAPRDVTAAAWVEGIRSGRRPGDAR